MLTRDQILARKAGGTEVVELPGGGEVKIRALTRNEVIEASELDPTGRANYYVATALVEPKLSVDDVAAWAETGAAGDLMAITDAVGRLSHMVEGAGKSGVPRPRKRR